MKNLIEKISKYKNEEICIISDFDDTLTKGIVDDNRRGSNSFSVFANNPYLLEDKYLKLTNKLFNYYYNIEQDPNIDEESKTNSMEDWWNKEFDLYTKYGLTESKFDVIIQNKLIELRDEVNIFFNFVYENKVSLVIFSAGIYNLIHQFLKKINCDYDNIHVVANIFNFSDCGIFKKTSGDIIHSQNKTFVELSHLPIYSELENKKVCILLGDSIGDLKMVDGANFEEVLKIGFLNKLPGDKYYVERFEAHKKNYDIVISGMEDFSKINQILKEIFQ